MYSCDGFSEFLSETTRPVQGPQRSDSTQSPYPPISQMLPWLKTLYFSRHYADRFELSSMFSHVLRLWKSAHIAVDDWGSHGGERAGTEMLTEESSGR